ncbi:MAG: hypothetical protein JJ966_08605 [Balneolaceae bacterium]|nr:hypothetical protein [Balneolaceae bacterium]
MKTFSLFCFVFILTSVTEPSLLEAQYSEESISIVVHESIETDAINIAQLKAFYTLNTLNWKDGNRIRLADYKGDNYLRIRFYSKLDLTPSKIKKIWLRAQFTGKSIPPNVVNSVAEMIEAVTDLPGTIGYVPTSRVSPDMRILFEISNDL